MNVHFTYSKEVDANNLKQGDILAKTDELVALIKEVHPHYANDEYTHFQILTQSCDLVRRGRNNECASRYITLAAIRDLKTVIHRIVENEVDKNKQIDIEGIKWCSNKHKPRVSQILSSLFNNNDKDHFFLKACPEFGLDEDSCSFLHLSIAIRAYQHYELCLSAKRIELDGNFQSKLGWLVGNLYSRVGTEDHVPQCFATNKTFAQHIEDILNGYIAWVDQKNYPIFKSCYDDDNSLTGDEILKEAESKTQQIYKSDLDTFVGLIVQATNIEPEQKDKLKNFLSSVPAKRFLNI